VTWLRAQWSRLTAGIALAAVALATGVISYRHIYELSIALYQPPMVARLQPVGVDGLIVVGSVVLLQASPNHPRLGWFGVAPGVAVSVFANIESGIAHGWLAAAWAGVPAALFALATFLLERWLKDQVTAVARTGSGGSADPLSSAGAAGLPLPQDGPPEPPEPLTPEAALLALIGTSSRRDIAALLGISKSRVDRWAATLPELVRGGSTAEAAEVAEAAEMVGSLNGNAPAEMNGDAQE
jgi:hypothetical protein